MHKDVLENMVNTMINKNVVEIQEKVTELCSDFEEALKHSRAKTDKITELEKALKDKYSTDTYVLVKKEFIKDILEQFKYLRDGLNDLDCQFGEIHEAVEQAHDESCHNDAGSYACDADTYIDKLNEVLNPKTEEVSE